MLKYRFRLLLYALLFAGVLGMLVLTCYSDIKTIYMNKLIILPQLENNYEKLLESEETLEGQVVKLQDPEYVAKYAREKYLFTKEGEYIIDLDEVEDEEE